MAGFLSKSVGTQSGNKVHDEIVYVPMSGMLNVADILQLIVDSFNHGAFSEHLVEERHQAVLMLDLDPVTMYVPARS